MTRLGSEKNGIISQRSVVTFLGEGGGDVRAGSGGNVGRSVQRSAFLNLLAELKRSKKEEPSSAGKRRERIRNANIEGECVRLRARSDCAPQE